MTTNAAAARAHQAYSASRHLSQNPRDVLAAVHEELYRALASAKFAHEKKALDQMCIHAARCTQILMTLSAVLRFSDAGADGATLRQFYQELMTGITLATRKPNVTATYQNMLDMLQPFCRSLRAATHEN